jgi:CBS domain-containing protein
MNVEQVLLRKGAGVISALEDTTVAEAARRMDEANVGSLLVEREGAIVGIVTERDFLRRVLAAGREAEQVVVGEVMSSPVRTCKPSDDIQTCARMMAQEHIRHVAVTDENGEPVGLISLRDVLTCSAY